MMGGGFIKCGQCGKICNTVFAPLCAECTKENTKTLLELKEYLHDNPEKNMTETAAALGITTKRIIALLESGEIPLTPGLESEKLLKCRKCKKPVAAGAMCDSCRSYFNDSVMLLRGQR